MLLYWWKVKDTFVVKYFTYEELKKYQVVLEDKKILPWLRLPWW